MCRQRAGHVTSVTKCAPVKTHIKSMSVVTISIIPCNKIIPTKGEVFLLYNLLTYFEGLVEAVQSLYYKAAEGYQCSVCEHASKSRQNMENHVEAKHVQTEGWPCHVCNKICPSKNAYNVHFSRNHKQQLML